MTQRRESRGSEPEADQASAVDCGPDVCPAGMCAGRGHTIVYGNPAMIARFGRCVGMPAREALIALPREAFELMDAVYARAKPLARWIRFSGERWRMTSVPRIDAVDGQVYGISFHLQPAERAGEAAETGESAGESAG